jgi:hypothetical protein
MPGCHLRSLIMTLIARISASLNCEKSFRLSASRSLGL